MLCMLLQFLLWIKNSNVIITFYIEVYNSLAWIIRLKNKNLLSKRRVYPFTISNGKVKRAENSTINSFQSFLIRSPR